MLNLILTCVVVVACLFGIAASAEACGCVPSCQCEAAGDACDCGPVKFAVLRAPLLRKECGPGGCRMVPVPQAPAVAAPAPKAMPAAPHRKRFHLRGRPHFR